MEKDKNSKKINMEDMEKKNIHSVPYGYFDKLPYSIQEKIRTKQKPWFEILKVSPVKYALAGCAVIILTIFIYVIIPKNQEQIAENKKTDIKKDTVIDISEKNTPKENNIVTPSAPLNNDPVAIEQKKIGSDSLDNNKNIPVTEEKLLSPESYLAEISNDDIQEYLELNEFDQLQPDEAITD